MCTPQSNIQSNCTPSSAVPTNVHTPPAVNTTTPSARTVTPSFCAPSSAASFHSWRGLGSRILPPPAALSPQTLKRTEAKRVSTQECVYGVFPAIQYEVDQLVKAKQLQAAVYSFDHAPAHEAAAGVFNWTTDSGARAPGAPRSPDMNKAAEHGIALVKKAFFDAAEEAGVHTLTAVGAQSLLVKVFHEAVTPAGVRRDVESLVGTMRVIAAAEGTKIRCKGNKVYSGVAGSWAPRGLR